MFAVRHNAIHMCVRQERKGCIVLLLNAPFRPLDDVLVQVGRELTAQRGLETPEARVRLQRRQQQGQLAKQLAPGLEEAVRGRAGRLRVAQVALHGGAHRRVDDARVVGEHVQRRAEVLAQPRAVRVGRREHGPEEGDEAAGRDGGEAVRRELVQGVVGLPAGLRDGDAEGADLEFVAYDEDLINDPN